MRTELNFLRDSGVLTPQQLESIEAQLPVRRISDIRSIHIADTPQQDGKQSQYVDPRFSGGQWGPQAPVFTQIAEHAQNPQSPANPQNAKVCHRMRLKYKLATNGHI